jgi:phosphatidylserine/phosphatidylglycerophosphate/cardiolipin synthase-like enzyme
MSIVLHQLTYQTALLSALRKATKNIYISIYVIKSNMNRSGDPVTNLFNILVHKLKQGLEIKILLDYPKKNRPNFHTNRFFMRRFYDAKIPFCLNMGFSTCHGKVISIDQSNLFLGSHNLARRSFSNPLEFSIQTSDKNVISDFDLLFLNFWNDPSYKRFPPTILDIERIYP